MTTRQHWDTVYETKPADAVSWYAPHLRESLRYVEQAASSKDAAIIDVGGGESTLVDDLLQADYRNITVLDISARAIEVTRHRLGPLADRVHWLAADILEVQLPPKAYDIWHDRAVFHFLTDPADQGAYALSLRAALTPTGHVIVATFAPDGPDTCSGLPVQRYDADALAAALGFAPDAIIRSERRVHTTPWGTEQPFTVVVLANGSVAEGAQDVAH